MYILPLSKTFAQPSLIQLGDVNCTVSIRHPVPHPLTLKTASLAKEESPTFIETRT
jgi:hypothetical protein